MTDVSDFVPLINATTGGYSGGTPLSACGGVDTSSAFGSFADGTYFPTGGANNSFALYKDIATSTVVIPGAGEQVNAYGTPYLFFTSCAHFYTNGGWIAFNYSGFPTGTIQDGDYIFISAPLNTGTVASNNFVRFSIVSGGYEPPPVPPTTEFNEVVNYIPSPGVATSTGTTTVGALFSIPSPDFIEYIGYRILSPTNEVLYDATTTPSAAALYTISTDFNFTDAGVYQGHAYFAQDFGGNIWEVDNPTIQQIVVDVPQWTVSPDGQFTQNPATTSTTTLPNLTLDCGTGFVSSVCNLIARLVIPSATSIGSVQASFQALISKAPFSFFTESKTILGAFKTGTASTGGTFALNLYGESVPIISTTTAAAIGMGSTQLDFLKFLMTVGLWLLLAWYLYWRIASIFGV